MVVKSATKKKLMDLGIPEEVAHVLSEDRRWGAGTGPTTHKLYRKEDKKSIKELMDLGFIEEVQEFVDIIRPVMNHYPFNNAPVENLMLWYGIIMEAIADPTLERPERPVFYSGVGHVLYLGGGKPPQMMKQRLQDYVKGPTLNEDMFKHAWNPESKHYAAINRKVIP